jgi:hypothetical protein
MPTSTVPAVTTALVALLQAAPELAGIQVSDGPPAEKERQAIWTYGVTSWTASRADFEGDRDEGYTIELAVRVDSPGDNAQAARAAGFELMAAVETVVRDNPSIEGASVDDQLVPRDHAVSASGTNEGYEAIILFGVAVEAFI